MAKTLGLRAEILITLAILLCAAVLCAGFVMLRFTQSSMLAEQIDHFDEVSKLYIAAIEINDADIDIAPVKELFFSSKEGCKWRFYDDSLRFVDGDQDSPFSSSQRLQARTIGAIQRKVVFPPSINIFRSDESHAHFLLPVNRGRQFFGLFEFTYSLHEIRLRLMNLLLLVMVYAGLYAIILTGAGYYLLQRNVVKPARNLLKATEAVGAGDLAQRLPVEGPWEITQLAGAYNHMVSALQHSRSELEQHILSLEQSHQQLNSAKNELVRHEKLASTGQLAAGLAHELGNPLAALIGYLEFLKQGISDQSQLDVLERSIVEAERIDFLVRELLEFSRPGDSSEVELLVLADAIRQSVTLLQNQGALSGVKVENVSQESSCKIIANRHKLQQVLVNLLLNAAQACVDNGRVVLACGEIDGYVWATVTDNGEGIDAAVIERIFDPFFTSKDPGQGIGLGLAVCQRYMEEAGGKVEVLSEKGEGTVFTLRWPRG